MSSRIIGWGALLRGGHKTCLCYINGASGCGPRSSTTPMQLWGVYQRLKSSAASVRAEEGRPDSSGDKRQKPSNPPSHKKPIMVMVGGGVSWLPFRSREAPALHHAHASTVMDLCQETTAVTPEVQFTVEQLLRESRKSLQMCTHSEQNEVEPSSGRGDDRPRLGGLVSALQPGALDWRPQVLEIKKLPGYYADLSKSKLTGLVVLTALAGYAMAPGPLEVSTLLLTVLGTGLVSAAANSINQFLEVPFDSQMNRTKNRILVRGVLTPLHAISFAMACSTVGLSALYWGVNPLTAALGTANLVLYTSIYTPSKRLTILNTWIGAVVGAIPPLMGWAGCMGELDAGAWVMAAILYAWQFPHFNSLSWNLRPDYSRAGYRMMAVTDPELCLRVCLRYSLAMVGICTLAPVFDVTTWTFAVDSLPFNGYLVYLAWKFYKDADSKSSRKLFLFTLVHLPVILMLMIISKKYYARNKNSEIMAITNGGDEVRKVDIPSVGT